MLNRGQSDRLIPVLPQEAVIQRSGQAGGIADGEPGKTLRHQKKSLASFQRKDSKMLLAGADYAYPGDAALWAVASAAPHWRHRGHMSPALADHVARGSSTNCAPTVTARPQVNADIVHREEGCRER